MFVYFNFLNYIEIYFFYILIKVIMNHFIKITRRKKIKWIIIDNGILT